jgi:hypothetical protein
MGRDALDRYYTPDALAEACLSLMLGDLPWPDCLRFAEPCCGGGAFGRAARRLMPSRVRVKGCDLDPEASPGFAFDVCSLDDWRSGGLDLIATNPPYKNVYEGVLKMRALQLESGAARLGLLLRATTIEQIMCSDDPPDEIYVSRQRPRWGGAGGLPAPAETPAGLPSWSGTSTGARAAPPSRACRTGAHEEEHERRPGRGSAPTGPAGASPGPAGAARGSP